MQIGSRILVVTFALAGMLAAACGDSPTTPATAKQIPVSTIFTGTLAAGSTQSQTFPLAEAGTVAVTLASLTTTQGDLVDTTLTLDLGTASATACNVTTSAPASPALKAQISTALSAGNYCVRVRDTAGLTAPLNFAVRIVAYPVTATTGTNVSESVASNLPVGGFVGRTFIAAQNGTITVTLSSVTPSVPLGIGLGLDIGAGTCRLTQLITADPGADPQLTMPADAGQYCVTLVDVGNLVAITRGVVPFTMVLAHP